MISSLEKKITFRYLKPKKKQGFLNIISIFSFIGISLGVAVLIIVMSVMNGFRTELANKILGFSSHIVVEPYSSPIDVSKFSNNKLTHFWTYGVGTFRKRSGAVKIALDNSGSRSKNAVAASDGFFPFRDGLDEAVKSGVTAVVQPGGSVRDQEVIDAANENNIAMIFTGVRHFKH